MKYLHIKHKIDPFTVGESYVVIKTEKQNIRKVFTQCEPCKYRSDLSCNVFHVLDDDNLEMTWCELVFREIKSKEKIRKAFKMLEKIIELTKIHPLKIRNVYIFGSRVYGTNREDSDYDVMVTACQMLSHFEIKNPLYNIHVTTPDKFESDLKQHDIHKLECIFAPDWAKLQIKTDYKFKLDKSKLQKYIHNQSFNSWGKGKDNILNDYTEYGLKSVFHSLRMLMFGIQIAIHGKIVDFSEANHLHKELIECDETEWNYYKEKYLPFKIYLEKQLKTLCI